MFQPYIAYAWGQLWEAVPNLLVFVSFTLLLIFLYVDPGSAAFLIISPSAENYLQTQAQKQSGLRIVLIIANTVFFIVVISLCSVLVYIYDQTLAGTMDISVFYDCYSAVYAAFATMDLFTISLLTVYGVRLSRYIATFPVGSVRERVAAARKVCNGSLTYQDDACLLTVLSCSCYSFISTCHVHGSIQKVLVESLTSLSQIRVYVTVCAVSWFLRAACTICEIVLVYAPHEVSVDTILITSQVIDYHNIVLLLALSLFRLHVSLCP